MPAANAKPHISMALAHLRFGVTGAGICVVVAALVQLIVFGFVHYTDVRYTDLKPLQDPHQLSVVSAVASSSETEVEQAELPPVPMADVNRVRTGWDVGLDRLSSLAVIVGVVGAVTLGLMCMLGVMVGAGGAVPGVEKAVTASTWSIVLAVLCLPVGSILGAEAPFPGVFSAYDIMLASSGLVNAGNGGGAALLATYVLLPTVAMGAAMLIVFRFRAGIEMGVIPESVSEYDAMLEKEMANIRRRGVASSVGGRAGTAMRQTMADDAEHTSPPVTLSEAHPGRSPLRAGVDEPEPEPRPRKGGRGWVSANDRRVGEPNPGDPLKRPI